MRAGSGQHQVRKRRHTVHRIHGHCTRRIAYYVIPSAGAFLALGQVIAGVVFQTGAFTARDSAYVWLILAGAALGLLATTAARLTSSAFFALGDTRTPFRYAAVRMMVGVALGVLLGWFLPGRLGLDPRLGAAGLTLAGGLAGWVEFGLLRRAIAARVGKATFGTRYLLVLWGATAAAASVGWMVIGTGALRLGPLAGGLVVLGATGLTYLAVTWAAGVPEARLLWARSSTRD
jgi:putative peptidoglycan lipid II flippase